MSHRETRRHIWRREILCGAYVCPSFPKHFPNKRLFHFPSLDISVSNMVNSCGNFESCDIPSPRIFEQIDRNRLSAHKIPHTFLHRKYGHLPAVAAAPAPAADRSRSCHKVEAVYPLALTQ